MCDDCSGVRCICWVGFQTKSMMWCLADGKQSLAKGCELAAVQAAVGLHAWCCPHCPELVPAGSSSSLINKICTMGKAMMGLNSF